VSIKQKQGGRKERRGSRSSRFVLHGCRSAIAGPRDYPAYGYPTHGYSVHVSRRTAIRRTAMYPGVRLSDARLCIPAYGYPTHGYSAHDQPARGHPALGLTRTLVVDSHCLACLLACGLDLMLRGTAKKIKREPDVRCVSECGACVCASVSECARLKCALRSHLWLKPVRFVLHGCRSAIAGPRDVTRMSRTPRTSGRAAAGSAVATSAASSPGRHGDAFQRSVASDDAPLVLSEGTRAERKRQRDRLRAKAFQQGVPCPKSCSPTVIINPPALCNRVAVPWGQQCQDCQCKKKWPSFMSHVEKTLGATVVDSIDVSDGTLDLSMTPVTASYYRPAGKNTFWWHQALVVKAWKIHGHGRFRDFQVAAVT